MKNVLIGLIVLTLGTSTGCESSRDVTGYGEVSCVGLGDYQDARFEYKPSVWNIVVGLVFFELFFIPPVVVAVNEFYCPIGMASTSRDVVQ